MHVCMCAYWSNAPHSFWNLHRSATSTDMFCKYCFGRPRCRWKSDCFHQLPRKLWQPRRRLRPLCPHPLTSNRGFPTHPSSESSDLSAQGFWPPCRRHEPHPPQARMNQDIYLCLQTERRTQGAILVRYRGSYIHDCWGLPGFATSSFLNPTVGQPLYTPKSFPLTMPPVRIMHNHIRFCEPRWVGWQPVRVTFAPAVFLSLRT